MKTYFYSIIFTSFFFCLIFWNLNELSAQNNTSSQPTLASSPYLPLDHWAYTYINLLMSRGHLNNLSNSVRPYRRIDVANSISISDSLKPTSAVEMSWLKLLTSEFITEINQIRLTSFPVSGDAGMKVSGRINTRDNQFLGSYATYPGLNLSTASFTSSIRGRIDRSLLRDKTYSGRKTDYFGARVEDGYGRFDYKTIYFVIGRFGEEWSPLAGKSLILSSNPYSYDKISFGIHTRNIQFRSIFSSLEPINSANRFFSSHRLDLKLNNGMQFGFSETVIYGGSQQGIDLSYLNPFSIFAEVQLNQKKEANENLAFDFFIPVRRFVFLGQILIDDFILDGAGQKPPNRKSSPDRLGTILSLIANDLVLTNSQLSLSYERIGSYTYNVKQKRPWQSYTFFDKGLGASSNDMDRTEISIKYFPVNHLILEAGMHYQRLGERNLLTHDFEDSTFLKLPFPSGVPEKTTGFLFSALYQPSIRYSFNLAAGYDYSTNYMHTNRKKSFFNFILNFEYTLHHRLLID